MAHLRPQELSRNFESYKDLILSSSLWGSGIIILLVQVGKLRQRKHKYLAQRTQLSSGRAGFEPTTREMLRLGLLQARWFPEPQGFCQKDVGQTALQLLWS